LCCNRFLNWGYAHLTFFIFSVVLTADSLGAIFINQYHAGVVMSRQNEEIAVGSLLAVPQSIHSGHWLGLVVNQEAGRKWVERDPCIEFSISEKSGPLLVRVLGQKLTEVAALHKSGLPEGEPNETQTVRWAFIQTIPNLPWTVAGPDVNSIVMFLQWCNICESLGMNGATFLHDVVLLAEYLRGVKRTENAMSHYEKKYFAMLEDVLPRA